MTEPVQSEEAGQHPHDKNDSEKGIAEAVAVNGATNTDTINDAESTNTRKWTPNMMKLLRMFGRSPCFLLTIPLPLLDG